MARANKRDYQGYQGATQGDFSHFVSGTDRERESDVLGQRLFVPVSHDFYRVVFCAFAIRENRETLNVMVRAFTRYIGDLSNRGRRQYQKHGKFTGIPSAIAVHFYPILAKVSRAQDAHCFSASVTVVKQETGVYCVYLTDVSRGNGRSFRHNLSAELTATRR
jgi:hypothetical protein